jgi:signal peptidase II
MKFLLMLALPLYALDQLTKWWVVRYIEFRVEVRPVIDDFFYLCHWDNTGSAFGLFKNFNAGFIVISVIALIALVVFHRRGAFRDAPSRWGVGLLLGGILGNLTDRLVHGHVVDFLLFDLHVRYANPWPAFNVADSCICVAAGLFILSSIREARTETPKVA